MDKNEVGNIYKLPKEDLMSLNTKSNPMTKDQFNEWLRTWCSTSSDKTISDYEDYGQSTYLYIQEDGNLYHLNADTKREAVEEYLKLLDSNKDLLWTIVPNRKLRLNKVAFGENKKILKGFYLYIIQ